MPSKEWQMIGVRLFYQILKLHRVRLADEMRAFGDRYVKDEFRQNRSASEKQYKQFIDAWIDYYKQLAAVEDPKMIGYDIPEDQKKYFSEDQLETLQRMKKFTFSKKKK